MKNIVYIAASIDGYIAKEDGNIDWLTEYPNPENSDFGFADFIKGIDAIVMGKNTFNVVLSFGQWPYEKPVFVLSNSLNQIPEKLVGKVEILNGTPDKIVNFLNSKNFKNLYIDGGKVIRDFLKHNLIDELIITRIPIILGKGIPLFTENTHEMRFEHLKTEILNNTFVKSHYSLARSKA